MTITKLTNFEPNTKRLHLRLIDSPQCTRPYDACFAQTLYACSSKRRFMYGKWSGIENVPEKRKRENERESKTECLCAVSYSVVRILFVCIYTTEIEGIRARNDSTAHTREHIQSDMYAHTHIHNAIRRHVEQAIAETVVRQ